MAFQFLGERVYSCLNDALVEGLEQRSAAKSKRNVLTLKTRNDHV